MYFHFDSNIVLIIYAKNYEYFQQELADLRQSDLKSFKDIQVDEANFLVWNGLIIPVSEVFLFSNSKK